MRRDPDGAVAERVLQLVERQLLSGTSELWRSWIESQRSVERAPHTGASLKTLRQSQGLTQQQVAERLGMTHPRCHGSKGCRDAKLSRIRAYVRARGGELQTSARFGDEIIPLD